MGTGGRSGRRASGLRRFVGAATALLAAAVLAAACESDLQGPEEGAALRTGSLAVTGSISEADTDRAAARTLSAAFDSTDAVAVRLVDPAGDTALVDRVRPFDPSEGTAEMRVETRIQGDSATLGLELDLRRGEAPLFSASRPVTLRAGSTVTAEVSLSPVAAGVAAPPGPIVLPTVGDTARVEGAVLFATGDTIPGRSPTWSSDDSAIVTATADGLLTAAAVGTTTVTASFEGHTDDVEVVVESGASARLEGRVVAAQGGSGVEGVEVAFEPAGGGSASIAAGGGSPAAQQSASTTTDAEGFWTSPSLSPGTYDVRFSHPDREGTTLFGAEAVEDASSSVGSVPLVPASDQVGAVSGIVQNARDASGVGGATVELREGVNAAAAGLEPVATTTADGSGSYRFAEQPAGTYTVTATAPDFAEGSRTTAVVGGSERSGQDVNLSPTGAEGEVRIVLSWGETPSDLDAHLTGPDGSGGRFHVYFGNRGSLETSPFAALDRDDVSSFGPETITITQVRDGVYRYSVHDFTNRNATPDQPSSGLAQSGAVVEVFIGGQKEAEFFPPNQDGTLWTVFELSGQEITPVNTMEYESSPSAVSSTAPAGAAAADVKPGGAGGSEKR